MCVTVVGDDGNTTNDNENNLHYLTLTVFRIIILLDPYHKSRKVVVMSVQSICRLSKNSWDSRVHI